MVESHEGWYAIHVGVGREDVTAARLFHALRGDALVEAFFPMFEVEQKFRGEWRRVLKPLWPGYVVAASRRPTALAKGCADLIEYAHVVEVGGDPAELVSAAAGLLRAWTRSHDRVVPLSTGVKEGDGITVLQGPLVGNEHLIYSMDRRKGIAVLGVDGLDGRDKMRVGLRVLPAEKLT